ncbi:MAG: aminoacetone oxidase family FAD-binding enzyme [Phycisphaerales bacterium]|nr:aminoacetone oxidase family FAD-binding enzyme [Phycisphaerales bacterium]
MTDQADVVVVGAGAAGLMAGIWAGRTDRASGRRRRILMLDGARTLGAKILVAGGGRCNVTHHAVDEQAYAGSTGPAIRKVLRRFDVPRTVEFFASLGVRLKREDTGKLFPVTDTARTVLNALLGAAGDVGVEIRHPCRVTGVRREAEAGYVLATAGGDEIRCALLVLATGGRSLPKTGSDGAGYAFATALGHTLTERIFPALVPLLVAKGHFIHELSGITVPTTLEVRSGRGRVLARMSGSTLLTHFGLSGPAPLDVSRYYLDAVADDPDATLVVNWCPGRSFEDVDAALSSLGATTVLRWLTGVVPERLGRAIAASAEVDAARPGHALTRDRRRGLAHALTAMAVPVTGDRGYTFAEVTAGGVPLREVRLETMASRVSSGLHLCGEICDVDGRIGGFNFQWAWASGYVAGCAVGAGRPAGA